MKILISGALAYDFVMDFPDAFKNHIMPDSLHILNVCFMIEKLNKGLGGTAGNIAYNFKMLGMEPEIFSALGKDADDYLKHFEKNKISAHNILQSHDQFTASAYITTDKDDNQITAFYNGPLNLSATQNLYDVKEKFNLAMISPTAKEVMMKHLKEAKEAGLETVFDPGQQITAFMPDELIKMIKQSDFIIGNDYEIKLLMQKTEFTMEEILQYAKAVIITLGEKGSIITTKEESITAGVCTPSSIDDPTGAGDAYRAGFFTAYLLGYNWKTCGQMGAVSASYAIENYGTQNHYFTKEQFLERYKNTFNENLSI